MKAAVLKDVKSIVVMECEKPSPKNEEVIVQVKACGICGTDQHIYNGHPGSTDVSMPIILGHELAGIVIEVGDHVTTLKVGDRVSVDPNIYCGTCRYCRVNQPQLCEHLQAVGVTREGGMGEYCAIPEKNCYVIPEELTFEEGALLEPLGCVLHGFKKIQLSALSRVLIIGGGFIGQLFLQLLKSQPVASVHVVEPIEEKYNTLYQLGADKVVSTNHSNQLENRYDVVIECVGRKDSMNLAIPAVKKGGQILLFGVASPETLIDVSPYEIFSKELTIKGSFVNPYTHEEASALVFKKIVQVSSLISHQFKVDDLSDVMAQYPKLQVSKGIIKWD